MVGAAYRFEDVLGPNIIGAHNVFEAAVRQGIKRVVLFDPRDPMSLTSAQSGENYRNWWPHPTMTAFTDHSTRLMEEMDIASGGRLNVTRGGYALVTRRERPADLIEDLSEALDTLAPAAPKRLPPARASPARGRCPRCPRCRWW